MAGRGRDVRRQHDDGRSHDGRSLQSALRAGEEDARELLSCAGADLSLWPGGGAHAGRLRHRRAADRSDGQGLDGAGRECEHAARRADRDRRADARRGHPPRYAQRGRDDQRHAGGGVRRGRDHHSQRGQGAAHRRSGQLSGQHGRVGEGRGHGHHPHPRRQAAARLDLRHHSRSDRDGYADDRGGGDWRRRGDHRRDSLSHGVALGQAARDGRVRPRRGRPHPCARRGPAARHQRQNAVLPRLSDRPSAAHGQPALHCRRHQRRDREHL